MKNSKILRHKFLRHLSPLLLTGLAFACATATTEGIPDGTGGGSNSGGSSSTGGGTFTGGSTSTGGSLGTGGVASGTGGMGGAAATGGASATGGGVATGGTPATGPCSEYGPTTSATMTGDFAVYTCDRAQAACTNVPLNVPALFECISSHVPNCTGQVPQGADGTWAFVGACSELGMGGAGNP